MPNQHTKIIAALCGFILIEILLVVFVDRPLALFVHDLDTTHHQLIDFFRAYTDLGKSKWYLWPCGLAVLAFAFLARGKDVPARYRHLCSYVGSRALFLFATIGLSGIATDILKPLIGRARPIEFLHDNIYAAQPFSFAARWNGFPSGHATTAFALAVSLSLLYPRLRMLWLALGITLAASRVMVDAHYVSDTVAGSLVGFLTVQAIHQYGMVHIARIFPIDDPTPPR